MIRKVHDFTLAALRDTNHARQGRFANMEEDSMGVPQQVFSPVMDLAFLIPTTSTPRQSYYTALPELSFHGQVTSPPKEPQSVVYEIADSPPDVIAGGPSAAGAADAHAAGGSDAHTRSQSETTGGSVIALSSRRELINSELI